MSIEEFFKHELNEWGANIEFYLVDLYILNNRLIEVAGKNTKAPIMAGVEHFQNQFIVKKNNLQAFRHKVKTQNAKLEAVIKKINGLDDLNLVDEQHFLREAVQLNEKILQELKHSFYRFLSKVF
jgi:hypothetical protein